MAGGLSPPRSPAQQLRCVGAVVGAWLAAWTPWRRLRCWWRTRSTWRSSSSERLCETRGWTSWRAGLWRHLMTSGHHPVGCVTSGCCCGLCAVCAHVTKFLRCLLGIVPGESSPQRKAEDFFLSLSLFLSPLGVFVESSAMNCTVISPVLFLFFQGCIECTANTPSAWEAVMIKTQKDGAWSSRISFFRTWLFPSEQTAMGQRTDTRLDGFKYPANRAFTHTPRREDSTHTHTNKQNQIRSRVNANHPEASLVKYRCCCGFSFPSFSFKKNNNIFSFFPFLRHCLSLRLRNYSFKQFSFLSFFFLSFFSPLLY